MEIKTVHHLPTLEATAFNISRKQLVKVMETALCSEEGKTIVSKECALTLDETSWQQVF